MPTARSTVCSTRCSVASADDRGAGGRRLQWSGYPQWTCFMLLPEGVDEEKIHVRYQDGILEVALEGAAAAREPRSIQIEVPPGGQQSVTDVEVGESTQGTALQGDAPPEAPPETPPR